MKYKIAAFLSFILLANGAYAQNTRNISLDEAIQLSLQNSKQLKLSSIKVDEATAILRQSWNNHLPDLKASGSYMRINDPNIDLKAKFGNSSTTDTSTKSSSGLKVNELMYGMVNASLPVFSGLKIHYGVQSARYLQQAAKLDADHDRDAIIQNTIDAYNNLYKAKKTIELVNQNLDQSKHRVTDFTNLEKNGIIARNDLLKVQLLQSNIELSLLDAENNWKMANINMDLMLGLPESTELLPVSLSTEEISNTKTITEWELTALQNRKDIQALSYREKAAIAGVRSVKGEYYPGVALTAGYIALNIPDFLVVTNALNVGVGVQYNIGSLWKTGAKVAEAKAHVQQVEINEQLLNDQVRLQINRAYQDYILSEKKILVYNSAVEQATENYKITKNKYDNNLATTADLVDADVSQFQAQLNYTYAQADAVVAYKKLLQTAGVLNTKN